MLKLIASKIYRFFMEDDKSCHEELEGCREEFEALKEKSVPKANMDRLESGKYADPTVEAEWVEFHEFEKVSRDAW
ncbi:hypothetical protein [Pseudomonas helleri]|uniref:hypothetical protein n=1 Tax=Pseudomonas helleri TaxID=1608996 RepID=UPI003FD04D3D